MNRPRNIIIASRRSALWLATAMLAIAPTAFAHVGFNHVMGTVAKISGDVLTVKTAKGDVDVKLGDRTELTRNDRMAQLADLKPGAHVVAEVPEESRDNTSQSVKIGAVTKIAGVRQKVRLPKVIHSYPMLIGCGTAPRAELLALHVDSIQLRGEDWTRPLRFVPSDFAKQELMLLKVHSVYALRRRTA